ncbi:MAG: 2-amino-4-hydroxy-6-hydroxymethyldihydropteridine diphosphokinase [Candidatus Saccharibacteria bacterium]
MSKAYIGLGTNLGDREQNLRQAREMLTQIRGCRVLQFSSIYSTAPWGKVDQPDFFNQVGSLETELDAHELLHALLGIERAMGRERREKWGPRLIDLDLLLFGDEIIDQPELKVPHPYLEARAFVLMPLLEIEPELILPNGRALKEVGKSLAKSELEGCILNISMIK